MIEGASSGRNEWVVPATARADRCRLAAAIEDAGSVPCQTSDPEAWWPDRCEVGEPPPRMALDASRSVRAGSRAWHTR